MCCRSPASPSETSIAARASPRRRSPSSTRGSGSLSLAAAAAISGCVSASAAERHGLDLIGGDTTRSPQVTIAVTALGEVPSGVAMYRATARADDDIWVLSLIHI